MHGAKVKKVHVHLFVYYISLSMLSVAFHSDMALLCAIIPPASASGKVRNLFQSTQL
jgi:hypothetical protein